MSVAEAGDTPILREYRAVKEQFPDAVVLARLGDFYEMFGADAEVAAPVLGVALTGRSFGSAGRVPMCGVPYHAAGQYIRRLLLAGKRVALWDQVGDVVTGRMVERQVTRVLSAGTAVESEFLEPATVSRCIAVLPAAGRVGIASLDASTGDLELVELPGGLASQALADEFQRLDAAEVLLPDGCALPDRVAPAAVRTSLPTALFDAARAAERLQAAAGTGVQALAVDDARVARAAAGAVLAYCERARIALTPGLLRVRVHQPRTTMRLDAQTRRNLELFAPLSDAGTSLLRILDRTHTPMGARLLRAYVQEPLTDVEAIGRRAGAVEQLVRNRAGRHALGDALRGVRDLERLTARCVQGSATPRELGAIRDACDTLPRVRSAALDAGDAGGVRDAVALCSAPALVLDHLRAVLADDLPANARDGGSIRSGADGDLDAMLSAGGDARGYIATLEARERERSGIRSLRVSYNRVFGYYIEVNNAHRGSVPADYIRKQTLVGAERFITADLKEQEAIVLHARDRATAREQELLAAAMALVAAHAGPLSQAAGAVAALDALQSLAEVADDEGWIRPEVDGSSVLEVIAGRHPVVERALGPGRFVPNDYRLDEHTRILVLTGPNMAGKSTYLRQLAIIVLLAQIGSHVPAERACIGVCDRIFTRIGAQDDLSGGMSTFMVEMAETAAILRQATSQSLVILDEIGRGTSTYDGLSIAQAVIEHVHESPQLGCRTLFATHYHELTALADSLARVSNARVEVVEDGDGVTFLHRIVAGGADRSYGIHVAKLAGVPSNVLARARDLLAELERSQPISPRGGASSDQLVLPISTPPHPVVDELAELDIDALSPIAALNKLAELRERAAT